MDLDSKQLILLAVYSEYQKDYPDYDNAVYSSALKLSPDVVFIALRKLQNEGLISGFETKKPDGKALYRVCDIMLTPQGQSYVEKKLSIEPRASGAEKLDAAMKYAVKIGWQADI